MARSVGRHNLVGKAFGQLRVKERAFARNGKVYWKVVCSCGVEKCVPTYPLLVGDTVSCGCKKNKRHGLYQHPVYQAWANMLSRCYNPNTPRFKDWGGRGVTVTERWKQFPSFWRDMGDSYRPGLTLERVNNALGYSRENCKWATPKEQAANRRPYPAGRKSRISI